MASFYKDTVLNILQIVSDLRGESTANTDAFRIRSLSRAERYTAQRRRFKIFLRKNVSLAGNGTNDYTIGDATYPGRENGLSEVFVGGTTEECRYNVVKHSDYQVRINNNSTDRICYEYYDQANDLFKFHINSTVGADTTLYYSYYYIPPAKTTSSDVIYCPNLNILVQYVLGDIADNEDEENGNDFRNAGEAMYLEAAAKEDENAEGQITQMKAIENSGSVKGIGSY